MPYRLGIAPVICFACVGSAQVSDAQRMLTENLGSWSIELGSIETLRLSVTEERRGAIDAVLIGELFGEDLGGIEPDQEHTFHLIYAKPTWHATANAVFRIDTPTHVAICTTESLIVVDRIEGRFIERPAPPAGWTGRSVRAILQANGDALPPEPVFPIGTLTMVSPDHRTTITNMWQFVGNTPHVLDDGTPTVMMTLGRIGPDTLDLPEQIRFPTTAEGRWIDACTSATFAQPTAGRGPFDPEDEIRSVEYAASSVAIDADEVTEADVRGDVDRALEDDVDRVAMFLSEGQQERLGNQAIGTPWQDWPPNTPMRLVDTLAPPITAWSMTQQPVVVPDSDRTLLVFVNATAPGAFAKRAIQGLHDAVASADGTVRVVPIVMPIRGKDATYNDVRRHYPLLAQHYPLTIVERGGDLAERFGVASTPTFVRIGSGGFVDRVWIGHQLDGYEEMVNMPSANPQDEMSQLLGDEIHTFTYTTDDGSHTASWTFEATPGRRYTIAAQSVTGRDIDLRLWQGDVVLAEDVLADSNPVLTNTDERTGHTVDLEGALTIDLIVPAGKPGEKIAVRVFERSG